MIDPNGVISYSELEDRMYQAEAECDRLRVETKMLRTVIDQLRAKMLDSAHNRQRLLKDYIAATNDRTRLRAENKRLRADCKGLKGVYRDQCFDFQAMKAERDRLRAAIRAAPCPWCDEDCARGYAGECCQHNVKIKCHCWQRGALGHE